MDMDSVVVVVDDGGGLVFRAGIEGDDSPSGCEVGSQLEAWLSFGFRSSWSLQVVLGSDLALRGSSVEFPLFSSINNFLLLSIVWNIWHILWNVQFMIRSFSEAKLVLESSSVECVVGGHS